MITPSLVRAAILASPLLATLPALAEEMPNYAAKFTGSTVKQEARPLDDKGHLVVVQVSQGTNTSTGRTEWMNGAQVVWSETIEMAGGNGPQNGLITLVKDGVSATSSYSGIVKTVMVGDRPMTTASGTWTFLSGSGVTGKGSGTYSLTMTSPTSFEGEWRAGGAASFKIAGTN